MRAKRSACCRCSTGGSLGARGSWATNTPSPTSPSSPWVRNLIGFYEARELVGFGDFPQVGRVLDAFLARPAVRRGLLVPAAD
jgi:hypothetical protein